MGAGHHGRMVGVLFTDIVGSTTLMFELGSAYEGLRRRHMDLLRQVLHDHGGTEVKNLGDGTMAVLPSAADCVAAAVAMQLGTHAQAAAAGVELQIRIGAAAGDAVTTDGDWFGPPVVEAARLCAMAEPGTILVSQSLRIMAAPASIAEFERRGTVELKGIPDPIEVHAVRWTAPEGPVFTLPSVLSGAGRYGLVGRDAERAVAVDAWSTAAAGRRGLLMVAGEPGVGKSRLAAEVAQQAHARGAIVLYGRCDPEGAGPFQPFVLALRQHLSDTAATGRSPTLGDSAAVLACVLPELAARIPGLVPHPEGADPTTERLLLFDAVADALHTIARTAPLMLVLEDLHWAAPQTAHLLRHVVGWPREAPLLVVATYRPTEVAPESPMGQLLAEAIRNPRCTRLALGGLDVDAMVALVGAAAREDVRDEPRARGLADALLAETGGNPLYATQVLTHLAEKGVLARRDGRWFATQPLSRLDVPDTLREVLRQRVAAAGPDVVRMLEVAAVAGADFDPILLERADDVDGCFVDALETAVRARLIEQVSDVPLRYRFIHELLRGTVYDGVSPLRRARLHDRLADVIEKASAREPNAALAHHATMAAVLGRAQSARAARLAEQAGAEAMDALEYADAAEWYGRAISHLEPGGLDDPADRCRLLVALGRAQRCSGEPSFGDTLLDAARRARAAGLVDLQVAAALANTRGTFADARRIDSDRVGCVRSALDVVGEDRPADRARLLAILATELSVGPGIDERRRLADDAIRLARSSGDLATLAWCLTARESAIVHVTTIYDRAAADVELAQLAERLSDPYIRYWATHYCYRSSLELGDLDRMTTLLVRGDELAGSLRQPEPHAYQARSRATYNVVVGDLTEAERWADRSLELGRLAGWRDAFNIYSAQLFTIRFLQGRLGELLAGMRESRGRGWNAAVWAGWAVLNAEIGDRTDAEDGLARASDVDFWDYPAGIVATSGVAATALAAAELGAVDIAERLLPVLWAAGDGCIADLCYWWGPAAHYRGVMLGTLGDLDQAADQLSLAVATERRLGSSAWMARSLAELAAVRRRRGGDGDRDGADQAADEALHVATQHGLAAIRPLLARRGLAEPVPG